MKNNFQRSDFHDLINRFINDALTDSEFATLAQTLERDPEARAEYIDFMSLHAELNRTFRMHGDDQANAIALELDELLAAKAGKPLPSTERTISEPVSGSTGLFEFGSINSAINYVTTDQWVPLILIAAFLTFFAVGISRMSDWPARQSENRLAQMQGREIGLQNDDQSNYLDSLKGEKNAVAVLTRQVDVKWTPGEKIYRQGRSIAPGVVALDSGLVQIDFFCGATMILEGPARFEIRDSDLGYVHSGKLRVFVPERASGFVIQSKECEVLDLGTEFAMSVDTSSGSEVHVIDGEVKVTGADVRNPQEELLTTGNAVRYHGSDQVTTMVTSGQKFVGPAELERMHQRLEQEGINRWLDSAKGDQQHPGLLAQYTFQESSEWDRTLVDSSPNSDGSTNGAIVGCQWTQGRWDSKRALHFSRPSHRVRLNLPALCDSITLAAWINLESVGERNMALVHPDTSQSHFLHWTLDAKDAGNDMSLHFSVTDSVGDRRSREHYNSSGLGETYPISPSDLGKWVHVAVTYDPANLLVTHYKNGQVVGSSPINRIQKVGLGLCNLGNWPYKSWAKGTEFEVRNLVGKMDEFSVFSEALSVDEIRRMYLAGRPD